MATSLCKHRALDLDMAISLGKHWVFDLAMVTSLFKKQGFWPRRSDFLVKRMVFHLPAAPSL